MSATVHQAWIWPIADDPEATSAFEVIRARLAAGRGLEELRKFRLIEITGSSENTEEVERRLHASTQFYNPHKERCRVRGRSTDPVPVSDRHVLVLVVERGGERRPAAERWWRNESGHEALVREGVVWALAFASVIDAGEAALELGRLRDARHGLLCNPWSQAMRVAATMVPLPWMEASEVSEAASGT